MSDFRASPAKAAPVLVCPWWFCRAFDNALRRKLQNPEKVLKPYIQEGWTALDVGPGMGYFTITLARLVGAQGTVIAADLQQQMLNTLYKRALKAGVQERIKLHKCLPESIGVTEQVDFALAFWMVHEVPDQKHFLGEIAAILKPGGLLLLAEPYGHVSRRAFTKTLETALQCGFNEIARPPIFISHTALLKKP